MLGHFNMENFHRFVETTFKRDLFPHFEPIFCLPCLLLRRVQALLPAPKYDFENLKCFTEDHPWTNGEYYLNDRLIVQVRNIWNALYTLSWTVGLKINHVISKIIWNLVDVLFIDSRKTHSSGKRYCQLKYLLLNFSD